MKGDGSGVNAKAEFSFRREPRENDEGRTRQAADRATSKMVKTAAPGSHTLRPNV